MITICIYWVHNIVIFSVSDLSRNRTLSEFGFILMPRALSILPAAHVLPLFKRKDPSLPSNYRHGSLLSCVSKVMERIIFNMCIIFFYKINLFYGYQAGFLPGHSTVFQLLETYHSIVKSIDDGESSCIVFCDLSKAFDAYNFCTYYIQ